MDIPVLIQAVPGKGFVARAGSPFDWTAEGLTADEALANLQVEAARHLSSGAKAAVIGVPNGHPAAAAQKKGRIINPPAPGKNPWLRLAGTWKDDPMIDEFQRAIEEYRRQVDNDPNVY